MSVLSFLVEDASLLAVSAVIYVLVGTDPNLVDKEVHGKIVDDPKEQYAVKRAKRSKYMFIAFSSVHLLLRTVSYSHNDATFPTPFQITTQRARRIGFAFLISGAAFRYWAMRVLGKYFSFTLAVRNDHKLVRSGPYSIVRHPSYSGIPFMVYGETLLMLTSQIPPFIAGALSLLPLPISSILRPWPQAVIYALPIVPIIMASKMMRPRVEKEEVMLSEAFGEDWKAYKKSVPWKIIPGIF